MRYFIHKSIPLLCDRSRERDDKLSEKKRMKELISWFWNKNRIVFVNWVMMFVVFCRNRFIGFYGLHRELKMEWTSHTVNLVWRKKNFTSDTFHRWMHLDVRFDWRNKSRRARRAGAAAGSYSPRDKALLWRGYYNRQWLDCRNRADNQRIENSSRLCARGNSLEPALSGFLSGFFRISLLLIDSKPHNNGYYPGLMDA